MINLEDDVNSLGLDRLGPLGPRQIQDSFVDLTANLRTLSPQLLGLPGRDNALYVKVNTGSSVSRVLFDCGADCLTALSIADVAKIDTLFFSHLHFDHIAGFDHFLRLNFNREGTPLSIFGPPRTAEILHHRFQGIMWDRSQECLGKFRIIELHEDHSQGFEVKASDGFRELLPISITPTSDVTFRGEGYTVDAVTLDHGIPCIGYILKTDLQFTIDPEKLKASGLVAGKWLSKVKDLTLSADIEVEVRPGESEKLGILREKLGFLKQPESIGYLTDFRLRESDLPTLKKKFSGCDVLVCENNYGDAQAELAKKNHHMTSSEVAQLAAALKIRQLILFHISDRYTRDEWLNQVNAVRKVHINTAFSNSWRPNFSL